MWVGVGPAMKWSSPSMVGCSYSRIHLGGLFRIVRESSDGSEKTGPLFISTYFSFNKAKERKKGTNKYAEVDIWSLYDMRVRKIIEPASCTRNLRQRANGSLPL